MINLSHANRLTAARIRQASNLDCVAVKCPRLNRNRRYVANYFFRDITGLRSRCSRSQLAKNYGKMSQPKRTRTTLNGEND